MSENTTITIRKDVWSKLGQMKYKYHFKDFNELLENLMNSYEQQKK